MNSNQREEFRYQFAGQALQGTLANRVLFDLIKEQAEAAHVDFKEAIAGFAVKCADELITELDQKRERPKPVPYPQEEDHAIF